MGLNTFVVELTHWCLGIGDPKDVKRNLFSSLSLHINKYSFQDLFFWLYRQRGIFSSVFCYDLATT